MVAPLPPSPRVVALIQYLQNTLGIGADEASSFVNLMWSLRHLDARIYAAPFDAVIDLAPVDPREGLEVVATALLSQSAPPIGVGWRIGRRIQSDLIRPGGFRFSARSSYVWNSSDSQFSLSSAYLEADGLGSIS